MGDLLSRQSAEGRIENAINYRERQVTLSISERTVVRNCAARLGVNLVKEPTGETANVLLLRLHGIVCNNIAYAGQQMAAAAEQGHDRAFVTWRQWREQWFPEKTRIELALKGQLSGPMGRN